MLKDTIKTLRTRRGFTQDELAIRLNVVRQTVSKWEKGLSVPDAEMLQRLAEELEVSVQELLGGDIQPEPSRDEIAQQLARLNEHLAVRNRRTGNMIKAICIVLGVLALLSIALVAIGMSLFTFRHDTTVVTGGQDEIFLISGAEMVMEPDGRVICKVQAEGAGADWDYRFLLKGNSGEKTILGTLQGNMISADLGRLTENTAYTLTLHTAYRSGEGIYPLVTGLVQTEERALTWVQAWE